VVLVEQHGRAERRAARRPAAPHQPGSGI